MIKINSDRILTTFGTISFRTLAERRVLSSFPNMRLRHSFDSVKNSRLNLMFAQKLMIRNMNINYNVMTDLLDESFIQSEK